jgi:hypothetical protein
MSIPPGITYSFQRLPHLLFPPLLICFSNKLSGTYLGIDFSNYVLICASIVALPLALLITVVYSDYANNRDAAALGAVLPPQVRDKWPGGLSLLSRFIDNFKRGYPGMLHVSS